MVATLKLQFPLKNYQQWDDHVFDGVQNFFTKYSVYPNILIASGETWNKINGSIQIDNEDTHEEESFDDMLSELENSIKDDNSEKDLQYWKDRLLSALEGTTTEEESNTSRYIDFDEESGVVNAFSTDDFSIDFCLDNGMTDDSFILIYDEDPSFDGEPGECSYRQVA